MELTLHAGKTQFYIYVKEKQKVSFGFIVSTYTLLKNWKSTNQSSFCNSINLL